MVLDELAAAIDEVCEAHPTTLADEASVLTLVRLQNRLAAVAARASACFADSGAWRGDGARSAAGWMTWKTHQPRREADRRVRLGRAVRDMPVVEQAWLAGDVHDSHASVLRSARSHHEELFERDEKILVDNAKTMRFREFLAAVDYWIQHANPDGAAQRDAKRLDRRRLHTSTTLGGMIWGEFHRDPINGAIVHEELRRLERALYHADWREAKDRCGDNATAWDLRRTSAQRRADALVEMATRSASSCDRARRPQPLFSVLVGYETLHGTICELANGTVVSPQTLLPWLDQAWLERVVFEGPSRVVDVGAQRRFFEGATRRAVQVRDRHCYHETCDEQAEHCEIDHIIPWAHAGPTTQANGRPACAFHNRQRNQPNPPGGP